jgi:riboflavin biosynthesis pyrimidine reductase
VNALTPLQTLYEPPRGVEVLLPSELARLYGRLQFPEHGTLPYVISNFVETLDGVVATGRGGGSEISGANKHDHMVMGLLRAVSDAVVAGAGTLRASPGHQWTAEHIYPPLKEEYQQLRKNLNKPKSPLNVIVTARGDLDPNLPVFRSPHVRVLVVTTSRGAQNLTARSLPSSVRVVSVPDAERVTAREIVNAIKANDAPHSLILVEGGPILMGALYAESLLDEQFLTVAPQVAGRDNSSRRPGLVEQRILAPETPVWGKLVGVKRAENHLFLRYAFKEQPS